MLSSSSRPEPQLFVAGGSNLGCVNVIALTSMFVFVSFRYNCPFCLVKYLFRSIHRMTCMLLISRLVRKMMRSCIKMSRRHVSMFCFRNYLECLAYTVCRAVIFFLHGLYADITHVDITLLPR